MKPRQRSNVVKGRQNVVAPLAPDSGTCDKRERYMLYNIIRILNICIILLCDMLIKQSTTSSVCYTHNGLLRNSYKVFHIIVLVFLKRREEHIIDNVPVQSRLLSFFLLLSLVSQLSTESATKSFYTVNNYLIYCSRTLDSISMPFITETRSYLLIIIV